MLYLYGRVSTDKQEHGKEAQIARLKAWAGDREVGGMFIDEDVSALSVRLQDRPEGKKLWDALLTGDMVACTKMDRMFRRLADMAQTIDSWKQLGIRLLLLDMDVDIESPHGRAFAGFTAVAAQLESELHGQRKREVYAHRRKLCLPVNMSRPFGWLSARGPDGKLAGWQECAEEQELGRRVMKMRDQGLSVTKIALALCREGHRKPAGKVTSSRYYHVSDVFRLERAARAGYPTVPREFWQAPDYAQKLTAMKSGGSPLLFAASARPGIGRVPRAARPRASRRSQG